EPCRAVLGNEDVAGLEVGVPPAGLVQACEAGSGLRGGVGCAFAVVVAVLPAVGEAGRVVPVDGQPRPVRGVAEGEQPVRVDVGEHGRFAVGEGSAVARFAGGVLDRDDIATCEGYLPD